ncbi:MAG: hypothetical protein M3493_10140 [Actinomycetota bacterium]|nr:hypothetical protein [Euzebyaceae bacterium]MDQ3453037.1 hypothetical protein [Actinomycetota bacterium]
MKAGTEVMTFAESGAPPWWLRIMLWGAPPAIVAFGWIEGGADGAAGGAVAAGDRAAVRHAAVGVQLRLVRRVRVVEGRLHVGRRSVPVHALDLSTMTFEVGPEVFSVFDRHRLMSNPIWLHDKLAVNGRHNGQTVGVVVSSNRHDELVAVLRSAHVAPDPPR